MPFQCHGVSMQVLNHQFPSVFFREATQFPVAVHAGFMSQVVVAGNSKAVLGHIVGKILISPEIFGHAMRYLDDRPAGLFGRVPGDRLDGVNLVGAGEGKSPFFIMHIGSLLSEKQK